MKTPPRSYFIGLVVGIGFGFFLLAALSEDGTITFDPGVWKVLKFGGLLTMMGGGFWAMRQSQ